MVETSLKLIFKRWLLLMGAYSFARFVFFIYNFKVYEQIPWSEVGQAFLHGLRFDNYAILWTNIIFWILAFIPIEKRFFIWPKIESVFFGLWNLAFLGLSFTDAELYGYQSKRLSLEMMAVKEDVGNQAFSMIFYYWGLSLIMIATTLGLIWFYPRRGKWISKRWPVWGKVLAGFAFIVFLVLGMRGGWQLKPIRPIHAFTTSSADLGYLTLNSAFTVIRSQEAAKVQRKNFFTSNTEVGSWMNKGVVERSPLGTHKNKNVVILILESFSLEYMGWPDGSKEQMPFLNQLASQSLFFPYHFANGRRSIDAVPSIVCGLPAMMLEPFPTSNFQGNHLQCLAHVLRRHGYKTLFFHGAQNGSMYIDSFALRSGFEKFYGENEFPPTSDKNIKDGHWGIFDGPFLEFAADEMNQVSGPFASVIFTLSSHHPYRIPAEWKGKLPQGNMEIHESIAYADKMLENFFKKARTQAWFKDTVFFITGDHTSRSKDYRFQNPSGFFRVPLIVFSGGDPLPPSSSDRFVQQADISPSAMDLLGIDDPKFLRFGRSVFNLDSPGRVVNYNSRGYWIIKNSVYAHMDFEGNVIDQGYWVPPWPFMEKGMDLPEGALEANITELKAMVQFFTNGLIDNSWEDLPRWGF